ncbi:MAG: toll/interleukin-1 receptor domain-containing protein [Bryobacterales bacterium]|nr:toll/interleukin-1 receptor domain-containing protein [Bryobacteraceae bacterium]MDW8130802.1 toll/interleukin-1 receptor domain-containing protein [Bryobacterales bacterium]
MSAPAVQSEAREIARLVRRCLEKGASVEIEGLGVFRPQGKGRFCFEPATRPKVFLAYVQEDAAAAERLYRDLKRAGFDPWMDRKKLLPGQNWPRSIQQAIEVADYFVACFSERAIAKRGCFQAELRYALDCARRVPFERTYFIPVRLEECRVPTRIREKIQYVDLFPDWDRGFEVLVAAMKAATAIARR